MISSKRIFNHYIAFLKAFVLALFVSHVALASLIIEPFNEYDRFNQTELGILNFDGTKVPFSSSLPQQLNIEDLLLLDDDTEDDEFIFSSGLRSSQDFNDYFSKKESNLLERVDLFFTSVPLYLLFKSWKVFLF